MHKKEVFSNPLLKKAFLKEYTKYVKREKLTNRNIKPSKEGIIDPRRRIKPGK
jgi:hypothetical protein